MAHDSKRDQKHSALMNPSPTLPSNQRLASPKEVLRLAPRLLSLFPQRVMLNSRELAAVVKLEQSSVPVPQLLSWATELYQAKPQISLSFLLQQLTQKAQRWQSSRIGEKYGASQLNSNQLEAAFDELIADLRQAEAEAHEQDIKQVIIWLIESVQHLKERSLLSTSDLEYIDLEGIFSAFYSLSKEAQERFFIAAPESLKRQVYQRVHTLLERESHRTRPQDFIIAQTAVWWSITRSELNLPPLRLRLFDGW